MTKANSAIEKTANKKHVEMETVTDKGTVKFNDTVISSIVKTAACEIPGVMRIDTEGNLFENIAYLMGHRKTKEHAIRIEMADDKINITAGIVVNYGKNIPQIANEVQMNVIQKVKEFTGLEIGKVDIIVSGVEELEDENNS